MSAVRPVLALALALLAVLPAAAAEYFVDCTRPDDSGSGLTPSAAKRTIQAAVEAAEADETLPRIVTVLPGTYDEGGKVVNYACDKGAYAGQTLACTNRVYMNRAMTLRARTPSELTEIVGAWDTSSGAADASLGIGPGAVRCLWVDTSERVYVKGFTFRDGAAQDNNTRTNGGYWPTFAGGVIGSVSGTYLVDCAIRHCSGPRGAAVHGGRLVRCRVSNSYGSALNTAKALHSLVVAQQSTKYSQYVTDDADLYNCTVFINGGHSDNTDKSYLAYANGVANTICNSLVAGVNYLTWSGGQAYLTNTVSQTNWAGAGAKDDASVTGYGDAFYMFKSPLDEDYRVRSDMPYLSIGEASYVTALNWPDEVEPLKDLNGNAIPSSGTIMPGCVQETFTPVCGPIRLNSARAIVDDTRRAIISGVYFYAEDKFAQHRLTVSLDEGEYLHSWSAIYSDWRRFPAVDDSLMVMPPYETTTRSVNTPVITKQVLWVNPTTGSDTNDGTEAAPLKTLLKAGYTAKTRSATSNYYVVFAAAGTYDEGSTNVSGGLSRVWDFDKYIRFIGAGAYGEGKSVIAGALDPDVSAGSSAYGRGPKAIRCGVLNRNMSCFQNFELRDGRVSLTDGKVSAGNQGGCIRFGTLIDCHVINCGAARGQVVYFGRMVRCLLTKPDACGGGRIVEDGGYSVSCVLNDQQFKGSWTDNKPFIQCSFHPNTAACLIGSGSQIFNCASTPAANATSAWAFSIYGLVGLAGVVTPKSGSPTPIYLNKDPCFADPDNDDFRIKSHSPAIGYGCMRSVAKTTDDSGYWQTYCPDLYGRKLLFFDGKPLPGAVHEIVQGVSVAKETYCTLDPSGELFLEPGASMTVSLTNPLRPPLGLVVDGAQTNAGATSVTITAPEVLSTNCITVAACFDTNWYVNASMPDDSLDGFTPETAKRTLCGAMTNKYVLSGDVVHAAEGVYDEGRVLTHSPTYSRVSVKSGVTLTADGDMWKTLIVGAPAPVERSSSYPGCGEGATRCANVAGTGVLRGFIITNGFTEGDISGSSANHACYGGGIHGSTGGRIEDCLITQCQARRGSGAVGGCFRRCYFLHIGNPYTSWPGGGCSVTEISSSYLDYCAEGHEAVPLYCNNFIGPNLSAGSSSLALYAPFAGSTIRNSIFCGRLRNQSAAAFTMTNCVYQGLTQHGSGYILPTNVGFGGQMTQAAILDNLEVDDHGLYVIRKDSVFIDQDTDTSRRALAGTLALKRGQRVYNAALDIGPTEYDWRGEFAEVLFDKKNPGTIQAMGEDVVRNEETSLHVPNGQALTFRVVQGRTRGKMTFTVTGPGTPAFTSPGTVVTASGDNLYWFTAEADQTYDITVKATGGDIDVSDVRFRNRGLTVFVLSGS